MSHSPFARAFIISACMAGVVFTASTLPLALSKSKVINIELQNRPIFSSELRDLTAPYLALSGSFGVAIGFGLFGILGWQNSSRKLSEFKNESSQLTRDLAIYQAELERIKFSESRLRAQNLSAFLPSVSEVTPGIVATEARSSSAMATAPIPVPEQSPVPEYQPSIINGYSPLRQAAHGHPSSGQVSQDRGEGFNSLQQQLNQLSQQLEELRGSNSNGLAA